MTKFEKFCQDNPFTARDSGALAYLQKQQKKDEAFEAMLQLLCRIRYCNWPTAGLGIDLHPEEMDEVIMAAEKVAGKEKKKPLSSS
jgi:hypothetical protein